MKRTLILLCSALLALPLWADSHAPAPKKGSKEFEKMKALVGTWKGTMKMGETESEFTTEYRLVAGGSVLEERIFKDTPQEMITMYHDKGGKLAMTHYCMLGNQPTMTLKSSDEKSISFDFDASCGIDVDKEMHMHSMVLSFVDEDTIRQSWVMYADGKAQEEHPVTLKRVKT